jgi:hypothetical protein
MLAVAYMSSLENATVSLKDIYTQHFLAGSKLSGEWCTCGFSSTVERQEGIGRSEAAV